MQQGLRNRGSCHQLDDEYGGCENNRDDRHVSWMHDHIFAGVDVYEYCGVCGRARDDRAGDVQSLLWWTGIHTAKQQKALLTIQFS